MWGNLQILKTVMVDWAQSSCGVLQDFVGFSNLQVLLNPSFSEMCLVSPQLVFQRAVFMFRSLVLVQVQAQATSS